MDKNKLFIPLSIIITGLIIAGAVLYTRSDTAPGPEVVNNEDATEEFSIRPVSEDDHILGNPDAEIIIVEYSDFECPFCGKFHPTMEQVIEEYGGSGDVAWVYRHFPIDQIHADARFASEASECVANLGGNDKFWEFSKITFTDQENLLGKDALRATAESVGINGDDYQTCVDEGRFADKVEADYQDGLLVAQADPQFGTPYSLIITKDGIQVPIRGAQPFEALKQVIDAVLAR